MKLERKNDELSKGPITIQVYDSVVFKQECLEMTPEGARLKTNSYYLQNGDYLKLQHPNGVGEQLFVVQWGKPHAGVH